MKAQRNIEIMQDMGRGPRFNLFTAQDHAIVRQAVAQLEGYEHSVVVMRFWEKNTISEIAEILDLSWQEVEKYLAQALIKLKSICLGDSSCSRATAQALGLSDIA